MEPARAQLPVLGVPVDVVDAAEAVARIAGWAAARESRYVCACNAHAAVSATRAPALQHALRRADLVLPDGAPVAWMLRRLGAAAQRRLSGPDLMWDYCAHAAAAGEPIYLYGSTEATLQALVRRLRERWPSLPIAGWQSPPFRELSEDEATADLQHMRDSGARTVWVGLGCPKQELWMAAQAGRLDAVMVGVGAAFDFHAGTLPRAPRWMQDAGLEWLHRLRTEPRRLWRRYVGTNTLFVVKAAAQLLRRRPGR